MAPVSILLSTSLHLNMASLEAWSYRYKHFIQNEKSSDCVSRMLNFWRLVFVVMGVFPYGLTASVETITSGRWEQCEVRTQRGYKFTDLAKQFNQRSVVAWCSQYIIIWRELRGIQKFDHCLVPLYPQATFLGHHQVNKFSRITYYEKRSIKASEKGHPSEYKP